MTSITAISLEYKNLFSDYDSITVEKILFGVRTKKALEIICHFYAQMHTRERDEQLQINYLFEWLDQIPSIEKEKIKEPVTTLFNFIKSGRNRQFSFFNNYSTLKLIQYLLKNYYDDETEDSVSESESFQLFKAYLYCTQEWLDNQTIERKSPNPVENFIEIIFPIQFPQFELMDFKDFRIQLIKSVYFFQFCDENDLFKGYLSVFLKDRNIKDWRDYVKHLVTLYVTMIGNKKIVPSVIEKKKSEKHEDVFKWLTSISINPDEFEPTSDFLGLRNNPVFKYSEDKFLFLNFNFLIDKFYQSIRFEMADSLLRNKSFYKGKEIKSVGQFLGIYGEHFSEVGLFNKVISHIFSKYKYNLKFSGEQLKKFFPSGGEPDYYIREKGKVYLFEFKDVTFASDYKYCLDYDKIKKGIFEKFVSDKKGKPEGVSQLVKSIEKMIDGDYDEFEQFDVKYMTIYPIIVFTDMSFSIPGVNYLLNREMRRQIENKGLHKKVKIKKLVMIELDDLIKFQAHLRTKNLRFNHCLNGYCNELSSNNLLSKVSPFSNWIQRKTSNMGNVKDPMLMDFLKKIL